MTQPAKAQEPSMEEILASIRRIIADDDAAKSPPNAAEPPPTSPQPGAQPAAITQPVVPPRSPTPLPSPAAAGKPPRPAAPPAPDPVLRQDEVDVTLNEPAPAPVHAPVAADEPADVLDLTESMVASAPAEGFRTIDGQSDLVFDDRSAEHDSEAAGVPACDEARPPIHHEAARSLISATTSAAVDSAFNTLAHTVLVQN